MENNSKDLSKGIEKAQVDLESMSAHMVRGSVWMVAMRWVMRGIGIVSTVILARLLTPDDFGIVAMATVVVGMLEVFAEAGADMALIQNPDATRKHYDTAWTFKILQGLLLCTLLVIAAPLANVYFGEPRVVLVIYVLAASAIAEGLQNIGVVAFRKELNFSKEFQFQVYTRVLTFIVTLSLALIWRSYFALVAGMVFGRVAGTVLSYVMHPYRPKLSLGAGSEIWSFSKWIVVGNFSRFLTLRIDEFVVGRIAGTAIMGAYHVASDLATLPIQAIIGPMGRALFPSFSKLSQRPDLFAQSYLTVVGFVAVVAAPVGFGIAAVAEDFIAVILGAKWATAAPLIQWLAIISMASALTRNTATFLMALGRVRTFAILALFQVAVLAPAVILAGISGDAMTIVVTRTVVTALFVPISLYVITTALPISPMQTLAAIWRPFVAGVAMAAIVRALHADWIQNHLLTLAMDIIVGAVSFTCLVPALWYLSGRPAGVEDHVLQFASRFWKRLRRH